MFLVTSYIAHSKKPKASSSMRQIQLPTFSNATVFLCCRYPTDLWSTIKGKKSEVISCILSIILFPQWWENFSFSCHLQTLPDFMLNHTQLNCKHKANCNNKHAKKKHEQKQKKNKQTNKTPPRSYSLKENL